MECPRCDDTTLAEAKVDEVVVDHCDTCGGIWLDFAQLERVLSRESKALRHLRARREIEPQRHDETLVCPRCHGILIRLRTSPEQVVYYTCLTCYGRWLDGSELRQIVGRTFLSKFTKLFEQLLR